MTKKLTPKQIATATKVIKMVAAGDSLRSACKQLKIGVESFRQWRIADDDIQAQYTRAREDRATSIFEDILDISDEKKSDPNDRRVRIDARKWMLGKMSPKRYGDKIDVTSGDKPLEPFTGFTIARLVKDDE